MKASKRETQKFCFFLFSGKKKRMPTETPYNGNDFFQVVFSFAIFSLKEKNAYMYLLNLLYF